MVAACGTLVACKEGEPSPSAISVNFMNEDGNILYATAVEPNTAPVYAGETPKKEQNAAETFEFVGWTSGDTLYTELPTVSSNTVFTATFTATPRLYDVTFVVEGQSHVQQVVYGAVPTYAGEAPEKEQSVAETFEFVGWTSGGTLYTALPTVTSNATFTATFTAMPRLYDVTFVVEGQSHVQQVAYGTVPTYAGEMPEKGQSVAETFEFVGWTSGGALYTDLPTVASNATFTATFSATPRLYDVTFVVDGAQHVQRISYGSIPAYAGNLTFMKDGAVYEIKGWDNPLIAVTGEVTYVAVVELASSERAYYSVNFVDERGNILYSTVVDEENAPVYVGDVPEKKQSVSETFEFVGWTSNGTLYTQLPNVTEHTVFTATFTETPRLYDVTFIVDGQSHVQQFAYGTVPSYAGEHIFNKNGVMYEITGWDCSFTAVTGTKTYTAITERASSVMVNYVVAGEMISIPAQIGAIPCFYGTPYRDADVGCNYVFTGWKSGSEFYPVGTQLPAVSGTVTYTAVFEAQYKQVTVTYRSDGQVIDVKKVNYGSRPSAVADGVVGRSPTAQYMYEFAGWKIYGQMYGRDLPAVTDDVTLDAVYVQVPRTYTLTVIYRDENGEFSRYSQPYSYGDSYRVESPARSGMQATVPYVSGIIASNKSVTVNYTNATTWDGSAVEWTSGAGTQSEPYLIESAAHLAYLAVQVDGGNAYENTYFRLAADLDLAGLAWTTIGNNAQPFSGTFDGNGHTVFGLYVNDTRTNTVANSGHALFSTVKNGTVKNLSVSGSVRSVARYTAIVVGYLQSGGSIENCVAYGEVFGYMSTGGIVGIAEGNVTNCNNYATVRDNGKSGGYRFGGIAGALAQGSISNCYNYGIIINDHGDGAAGIVSRVETTATITDCANYGYVRTAGNTAGGIVGNDVSTSTHSRLVNHAPINAIDGMVGGIVGGYNSTANYTDCTNYGYISGSSRVGGIVGRVGVSGTEGIALLKNAVNYGNVYATGSNCAGIAGASLGTIEDCINYGTVRSLSTSVAGIVGTQQINTTAVVDPSVARCVNYGDVITETKSTNAVLGGIAGRTDAKTVDGVAYHAQFVDCINHGDVIARNGGSYSGGIIGACNGGYVTDCENNGTVLAANGSYVGGIAGSNYGYGKVTACTNTGAVKGGATVGQICGQRTSTSKATENIENGRII